MSDILSRVYRGNYFPQERICFPDKYRSERFSQAADMEDRFERALPENMRAEFREYLRLDAELSAMEEEAAFIEGVRFGAKVLLAACGEET